MDNIPADGKEHMAIITTDLHILPLFLGYNRSVMIRNQAEKTIRKQLDRKLYSENQS
jgi:hypothetical protein